MLRNEGPKNLFRILQYRDIDMDSLQGKLVDHACLVDPYILNREADMIQWKLLLVDGAHYNGMKKRESLTDQEKRSYWLQRWF